MIFKFSIKWFFNKKFILSIFTIIITIYLFKLIIIIILSYILLIKILLFFII